MGTLRDRFAGWTWGAIRAGLGAAVAVALGLLVLLPAPALAGPPGRWTRVTSMGTVGNIGQIGLQRTADGVLHVLWPREGGPTAHQVLHSAIPLDGKGVLGPNLVFSNSSDLGSINESVDLVAGPNGGLRAFFSGIFPGAPYDSVVTTATASAGGTSWSGPAAASYVASGVPRTVYAAIGISAAVSTSGVPVSTWGDSCPGCGGIHYGIDPAAQDVRFGPSGCCIVEPNVAVDSVSGDVVVAWEGPGEYIEVSDSSGVRTVPGSGLPASVEGQRVAISGRIGAPGVYVAYLHERRGQTEPALWRVGAPKATGLALPRVSSGSTDSVTLAPAPGGKLWIAWQRGGRIFATRTNPAATRFGSIVSIRPPRGTQAIYRLNAEGSRGFLDLLALVQRGSDTDYWHQRLLAGLTLLATHSRVKPGGRVGFRVTDAGTPVKGAKVVLRLGKSRRKATTNGKGRASITIPRGTRPKRYVAVAGDSGYAKATLRLVVRR